MGHLRIHILADKSDPASFAADLPGAPSGRWPRAGVVIDGEPPDTARLSTTLVKQGIEEGWIVGEGQKVVTRPAGPADDPWRVSTVAPTPHIFHHFDALVVAGVRYKVTHQPDKYAAEGDDTTTVTPAKYAAGATRVDHFYDLDLEG
jgi:hypothetical protein